MSAESVQQTRVPVGAFLEETVLPALQERLDTAFPEFGFRPDALGWVATNEETTHRALGVRAERVVAHGPAPPGILIHGGDAIPWTAYLNGGQLPRGEAFVATVKELAARAGVDTAPIEREQPRDRRTDLLHDFFILCRMELHGKAGAQARDYLRRRGLPAEALDRSGLGVVPPAADTKRLLETAGYAVHEINRSGVLADGRWPGRLCGAWRNEWGRIGTFWARTLDDREPRYLYLRGATRTNLPPYGFKGHTRELVLVEGFLDYHQLAARGVDNVAALGGTSTSDEFFERLSRRGVETVVLCLDNDDAGRRNTERAVERAARARASPAVYVVSSNGAGAKDPDELVRKDGVSAWCELLNRRECGVVWRAKEMLGGVARDAAEPERRTVLRRVGAWLGTLPPRLALEQEDAVRVAAERCGYSPEATMRDFQERFFRDAITIQESPARQYLDHRLESDVEF